jgi:hypothetical protein
VRRGKISYNTGDGSGWRKVCDDTFLAQFRGLPCELCGATHAVKGGVKTRSCGHHILEKDICRAHRYSPENIVVLCPKHHARYVGSTSPHSKYQIEQGIWWEWLMVVHGDRYDWAKVHKDDKFEKEWCYRDKYIELGGEIESKTGLIKDLRPINHAGLITRVEGDRAR